MKTTGHSKDDTQKQQVVMMWLLAVLSAIQEMADLILQCLYYSIWGMINFRVEGYETCLVLCLDEGDG